MGDGKWEVGRGKRDRERKGESVGEAWKCCSHCVDLESDLY